ncbi:MULTISPECIES: response regulator transcription factor [unclassified Achromobacter]|uniref:response regulator transcription factor n=1 Tax=unclassified Achromobacter TaxID=2626865 RepID=UPI000B51C0F3|nr:MULTISPECIES: response regulator transcription factor [unclassified Achromobacter]OWT74505.1 DNA-binding response regulator [Achromobacter sp. HZ34]OWT78972.1 DNA-binding response regulator [Achromobacter sp. HZ28]
MHLLLVEDDPMLGDALGACLRQAAYQVDWVTDAAQARAALTDHAFDAVLLDLQLPHGSGLAILRGLRDRYDATPVIILSARDRLSDRIKGLDEGADDYLVKPFPFEEVLARLRAVTRRASHRVVPLMQVGDVHVDPARRSVMRDGTPVKLSIHEYRTLVALLERQGHIVTREQLEDAVYGRHGTIESNTVAVYIHQLRRKLGNGLIATVHGFGYRIGEAAA